MSMLQPDSFQPDSDQPLNETMILNGKLIQIIAYTGAILSSIYFVFHLYSAIQTSSIVLISIYSILYIGILATTLIPKLKQQTRAYGLSLFFFLFGFTSLFEYGVSGDGRYFFVASVLLLAISSQTRTTIIGSIGVFLVVLSVGLGMSIGILPPPETSSSFDSMNFVDWVTSSLVFLLLLVIIPAMNFTIITGYFRSIIAQKENAANLLNKNQNLDNYVLSINTQLTRNARQIEIAGQIAKEMVIQEDNLIFLEKIVTSIKESFGFYYTGIFLVDDNNEYIELKASTGDEGKHLLSQNYKLHIDEESIIGNVIGKGENITAHYDGVDTVHFIHPLLPNTRSELVLPLHIADRVIGALDILSEEESTFSKEDVSILGIIADQLTFTIERFTLLKRLDQAKSELETGYKTYSQDAWQSYFRRSQSSSAIQYSQDGIHQNIPMPSESLHALMKGEVHIVPIVNTKNGRDEHSTVLAVPIRLRNQILGVLNINLNDSAQVEDLQVLAEALSDRLALALENARLLEQLQSRVEQEHLVSNITTKLRSAVDVNEILRTTATELGRSLGVNEVRVQLLTSKEE